MRMNGGNGREPPPDDRESGDARPGAGQDMAGWRYDPVAGFLAAVEDYLEETGMAPSTFGILTSGDPSLVLGLRKGRVCRLAVADRVLEFMGLEPVGPGFSREVEAYLSVTRTKPYLFGRTAMANPTFVTELRRGVDMTLETVGRVRRWMDDNGSEAERERIRALTSDGTDGMAAGGDGSGVMPGDGEEWMEMTEVASLLGFSSRTLHRYLEDGGGPACRRIGARVLYRRADVMAWIWAHRVDPSGPGSQERD